MIGEPEDVYMPAYPLPRNVQFVTVGEAELFVIPPPLFTTNTLLLNTGALDVLLYTATPTLRMNTDVSMVGLDGTEKKLIVLYIAAPAPDEFWSKIDPEIEGDEPRLKMAPPALENETAEFEMNLQFVIVGDGALSL